MNTTKLNVPMKGIVSAVLLLVAFAASAGKGDPEAFGKGYQEKAQKEWNSEKQKEYRETQAREARSEREYVRPEKTQREAPAVREVPAAPRAAEPKTTYIREPHGGITVVQSTGGGSQVSHLRSNGQQQRGVTSNEPRHAQYVNEAQRSGGEVISKEQADREISEIKGRVTERQARERQEDADAAARQQRGSDLINGGPSRRMGRAG